MVMRDAIDSEDPGSYTTTFRAPDRHGVFKFVIDYKRKGLVLFFATITIFLPTQIQMVLPPELNHCSCRATAPRRVPAFLERGVAILRWRDQHQHWVRGVLCDVLGGRCQGREKGQGLEARVDTEVASRLRQYLSIIILVFADWCRFRRLALILDSICTCAFSV